MKSIWVGIKCGTLLATGLRAYAADPDLQQEWMMVKKVNKMRLAECIEAMSGVKVSLDAMFDVQTNRIHEYKRQLLNILGIIHRYDCIKNVEKSQWRKVVPHVCIIGGKAAPGYEIAKKIIKLCHAVAEKINNDTDVGDLLKLHLNLMEPQKTQSFKIQNPERFSFWVTLYLASLSNRRPHETLDVLRFQDTRERIQHGLRYPRAEEQGCQVQ